MADRPLITGSFNDSNSADRAYNSFRERGYTDDDIHIMMSDDTKKKYYDRDQVEIEEGSKAMEGAGAGAAVGGSVGGILGALAAVGTAVALPGIGLVAGPLVGALAGAGAGGAAGSLLGALVGAGIPEEHAKTYKDDIDNGRIVMGVNPRDEDQDYFRDRYTEYGANNVYTGY